jgi:hypothetical protein
MEERGTSAPADDFSRLWSLEDLARRWGAGTKQARRIVAAWSLRPVPMGHRTVRYRPAAVLRAEEDAERRGARERDREKGIFRMKY